MGKRRAALLMAGVLAVTGLAGCGGAESQDSGAKEKVRLMVWSPSEDQSKDSGQWLQNTCEDFAELHPEWDITFVYGIADEATAANQVAQDPEESADVFMYANDTLTIMTDANALAKFGGKYREEIETTNSPEVLESLVKDGDLYGVPFTNSWYLPSFYIGNGCNLFGDGTDESKGVDFSGEKAAEVTDYLIDLAANPNFEIEKYFKIVSQTIIGN